MAGRSEARASSTFLFEGGRMRLKEDASKSVESRRRHERGRTGFDHGGRNGSPGLFGYISQMRKSRNTHSAVFAEVRVDEDLGIVRVTRIVSAVAGGRIINPKTARSQILGGVVMGVGMALHEETRADKALGRFMNHNFAEYHVPGHADIEAIDVIFVDEPDAEVTPLGVKGLGEIGIVSAAAAIANAIYHATGKRIRSLPITVDKLLD